MESHFQLSVSVSNIRRFLKMDNMLCNYMTDEVLCLINFDCWPIIQQITADVAIREVSETQLFTFYFQMFKSHLLDTPQLLLNTSELKMQWLIWDLIYLFVCLLFMFIYVMLCFIIYLLVGINAHVTIHIIQRYLRMFKRASQMWTPVSLKSK